MGVLWHKSVGLTVLGLVAMVEISVRDRKY
jgi:hypothetical protein